MVLGNVARTSMDVGDYSITAYGWPVLIAQLPGKAASEFKVLRSQT